MIIDDNNSIAVHIRPQNIEADQIEKNERITRRTNHTEILEKLRNLHDSNIQNATSAFVRAKKVSQNPNAKKPDNQRKVIVLSPGKLDSKLCFFDNYLIPIGWKVAIATDDNIYVCETKSQDNQIFYKWDKISEDGTIILQQHNSPSTWSGRADTLLVVGLGNEAPNINNKLYEFFTNHPNLISEECKVQFEASKSAFLKGTKVKTPTELLVLFNKNRLMLPKILAAMGTLEAIQAKSSNLTSMNLQLLEKFKAKYSESKIEDIKIRVKATVDLISIPLINYIKELIIDIVTTPESTQTDGMHTNVISFIPKFIIDKIVANNSELTEDHFSEITDLITAHIKTAGYTASIPQTENTSQVKNKKMRHTPS